MGKLEQEELLFSVDKLINELIVLAANAGVLLWPVLRMKEGDSC